MTDDATTAVLWVTGAYAPEFSAGGLQCQAIAHRLRGRVSGYVLTTSVDPALPVHEVVDGIPVSRVRVDLSRRLRATATLRMLAELLRLVPRVKLIHIQGVSSKNILIALVAKIFRRPLVLHLQTARHDEPDPIRSQGAAAWWAYSTADLFISVSTGLTECYRRAGLPPERLVQIPNGVDPLRFKPATAPERAALRRQLGLPIDRAIVLFVGVMSPDKQPDVLFDAWARLQASGRADSTLVFVGASDPKLFELGDQLSARIARRAVDAGLSERVIFVPPTRTVEDYYRAADVFVLPSVREGLPIVMLEAMACGLACVASNLPGSTDAIATDGESARLVPVGDVAAFAAALDEVLGDRRRAAALGEAARAAVTARYTFDRVADQWHAAYRSLLSAS